VGRPAPAGLPGMLNVQAAELGREVERYIHKQFFAAAH
jgi:hypothetical protein